jgi:hypothetical protein
LRRSGIDASLIMDGKVYFAPRQGVTSASTAGKVSMAIVKLRHNLRALVELVLDPAGQFVQGIPEAARDRSHFSLALTPLGVGIIERETNCGWAFPDHKFDGTPNFLGG